MLRYIAASACWQLHKSEGDRDLATRTLSNGLAAFPASTKLLLAAAAWAAYGGKRSEAIALYRRALDAGRKDGSMAPDQVREVEQQIDQLRASQ